MFNQICISTDYSCALSAMIDDLLTQPSEDHQLSSLGCPNQGQLTTSGFLKLRHTDPTTFFLCPLVLAMVHRVSWGLDSGGASAGICSAKRCSLGGESSSLHEEAECKQSVPQLTRGNPWWNLFFRRVNLQCILPLQLLESCSIASKLYTCNGDLQRGCLHRQGPGKSDNKLD